MLLILTGVSIAVSLLLLCDFMLSTEKKRKQPLGLSHAPFLKPRPHFQLCPFLAEVVQKLLPSSFPVSNVVLQKPQTQKLQRKLINHVGSR